MSSATSKSENKKKGREYNLEGLQTHPSCVRFLLSSDKKFDSNAFNNKYYQDPLGKKVFVTNLSKKTTRDDLVSYCEYHFGKVEHCVLKRNKRNNYAFVTFTCIKGAMEAISTPCMRQLHKRKLIMAPADSRHPSVEKKGKNEKSEESSPTSLDPQVVPLIQILPDNCLENIFHYLSIVDRIRVERVCQRWREVSRSSWRNLKRLDVDSSSWGCKSADLKTTDLYEVLKRCGRFIRMITFFDVNKMMPLRTVFIIGRLCPQLEIAYLGILEVTPREITFLLTHCPKLKFLEFDCYHFKDRDFIRIFQKSTKLKYVSIKDAKVNGTCLFSLPEKTETLVFYLPTEKLHYVQFHEAIARLKNLQNLYLSIVPPRFDCSPHKEIPVFDDNNYDDDDDDDYDDNHGILHDIKNYNCEKYDPNCSLEDTAWLNFVKMIVVNAEGINVRNNSQEEDSACGPKPQSSAKKEEDPSLKNQSKKNEGFSMKKEYMRWKSQIIRNIRKVKDDNDVEELESAEDRNYTSSASADLPEQEDNKPASLDTSNLNSSNKTSDTKISKAKTCSNSSDDFSRNHEFDSNSSGSFKEVKVRKIDEQKDKESDSIAEVGTMKEELETNEEKKMPNRDFFDCGCSECFFKCDTPAGEADRVVPANIFSVESDIFSDIVKSRSNFISDALYNSYLMESINGAIMGCNKELKILQLKRFKIANLSSYDLITSFTNFTSLERLDISLMKVVDDDLLTAVGANCPKLSVLIINGCDLVTDIGIGGIALLPELKYLSMSDLPRISGKSLEIISSLKILYCARCEILEAESLKGLIFNSDELEQLDVQECKLITNSLIDVAVRAIQYRTNSIKLKVFGRGTSIDFREIQIESENLEIVMERRFEKLDSFVDGELGTEKTRVCGDHLLQDFRGIIFESSTITDRQERNIYLS